MTTISTSSFDRQLSSMQARQGWNDDSMLSLALDFIRSSPGLRDAFLCHAFEKLKDENSFDCGFVPEAPTPECANRFERLPCGLDEGNLRDMMRSAANDEMHALTDLNSGGIVAYVLSEDRCADMALALNRSAHWMAPHAP